MATTLRVGGLGLREVVLEGLEHLGEDILDLAGALRVPRLGVRVCNFFGGLVLGCIKTKFCKKICV